WAAFQSLSAGRLGSYYGGELIATFDSDWNSQVHRADGDRQGLGSEYRKALTAVVLDAALDVCISYPEAGGRRKWFFKNSAALLRTLAEWKQKRRDDIWLTWGRTPDSLIGDMEELIREAGVSYCVPSGKRSRG